MNSFAFVALALALCCAGPTEALPRRKSAVTWVPTPIGSTPNTCVHQVPAGSSVRELPDEKLAVRTAGGSIYALAACTLSRINATASRVQRSAVGAPFSGWLSFATSQSADLLGYDHFRGSLRAPNLPREPPPELFLSVGTQNQAWLPLANSTATRPRGPFNFFGISLRYPASTSAWALGVWFATAASGTVYTTERNVEAGQRVDFHMQRTDTQTWMAKATVRETGEYVQLQVSNPCLAVQAWAAMGVAGAGLQRCSQLHRGDWELSEVQLLGDDKVQSLP
eukprot:CAMPEP_0196777800 /NCGR_PEP_ID=MMETSP1104-20130614/5433_1 /TAXON_ID=33652 /ORGANISM="Cafeteria sp., Strain Caron Lab Isolate" /LENGTH=280 /DNA_ID=CAMNT_0042147969 /DNA_START=63 /DNA_END=902 /DNA_ORIENTATION=-